MFNFLTCPRCGGRSLERLETYSHCCECLFFEDYWTSPESSYVEALNAVKEIETDVSATDDKSDQEFSPELFEVQLEIEAKLDQMKGA